MSDEEGKPTHEPGTDPQPEHGRDDPERERPEHPHGEPPGQEPDAEPREDDEDAEATPT